MTATPLAGVPSLANLALEKAARNFEGAPFRSERLEPEVATAFYSQLQLPDANNISTLASYVDSDEYWKQASNTRGLNVEEHGQFKRLFCEHQMQEILNDCTDEGGPSQDEIIGKIKPIADEVFALRLSGIRHTFPLEVVSGNLPNLTTVDLKSTPGFRHGLAKALASCPMLVTLAVSECQLGDDHVEAMLRSLAPTLLHLDLSNNRITSAGATMVSEKLIADEDSILACLDLTGNRICSQGGIVLGRAIATNESLLSLTLRLNNIGDDGGRGLVEGLRTNNTLQHLNLSANKLGKDTAAALLALLPSSECNLESLALTSNSFAEEELIALGECGTTCRVDIRVAHERREKSNNGILASEMPCSL